MSNTKIKQEGWREVKLGEVTEIKTGKSNSQDSRESGKYPLFDRSQTIKRSDRYLFDTQAIIVAGEGKEFIPRYYQGKFDLHQRVYAIFNFSDILESKYVYYYLICQRRHFLNVAVGSTVPSLRLSHFQNFSIVLPPLPEQKAIAEVLSSLDDKIDLLHRQNKTLEDMAQTLFRHWFVENSPPVEGWQSEKTDGVVSPLERYQAEPDEVVPQRSTKDYLSLPYNPKLKKRASELRKAGNLCEVLLWEQMKSGKLKGLDFDRQKIIGNYIVDFYCASLGLVIEIDGISHDDKEKYDSERDAFLERLGLTVIHIADKDVREDLAGVMEFLSECVACEGEERPPRQASPATPPQEGNYPASGLPRQGRGMGKIGEGWRVGKVSDLADILSGFAFKSTSFVKHGKYQLITIKNVQDGHLDKAKTSCLEKTPENMPDYCLLINGDIILSLTGNVGRCCLVTSKNLLLNQRVAKIQPKNQRDWAFIYILFRGATMKSLLEEMARGTAQANLSPIETAHIELTIPTEDVLEDFSITSTPILEKILNNEAKIRTLENLRDTLLPKLMRGQARVKQ